MKHIMATVLENQSVLCCKHPEHILDSCTHCPMESGQKERLKYLGQEKEAVFRQEQGKILKFHKEDIATRKKVGAQLRYPSPGSNTAKFSGKSHSASWHLTLSTHRQTQATICPLLLREDSPWHLSPPLTKAYLLFHIRRKKNRPHPLISTCNPHRPIRTFFPENPLSVPFQHSLGSPEELSRPVFLLQSSESKPVSLASRRFTWRQAARPRNRPLRMLPRAQEDSPNDWKWERVGSFQRSALTFFIIYFY